MISQTPGRSNNQVLTSRYARQTTFEFDSTAIGHLEPQHITHIEKLKDRLQFMVTIRATAGDMQEQI